jgi:phage protein D
MSGELRKPRSIVTINGIRFAYSSWEVNNNGYYQADTFTVSLTLTQPDQKYNAAWWSEQTDLEVIIYDGFPADADNPTIAGLTLRIQGRVDSIELNPIQKTVRVTGRDYTSKLTDTKIKYPSPNVTASDVAIAYAKQFGLGYSVTTTTTKIGKYYQIDHANVKAERTAWDTLCYLAHQEQFIVSVSGQTLVFGPLPPASAARVLTLDDSSRITTGPAPSLSFNRHLTLAKGVVVYVRSWNDKTKKGFTVFSRMKRSKDAVTKKNSPKTGEEQVYVYTIPNLTRDQAQQRANAFLSAISKHEVTFSADEMPGDPTLSPFEPVKWEYQGTAYGQVYFLDSIVRSFDCDNGYRMSLRGKNHSIESMVLS